MSIDRVITEESGKVFPIQVDLFILDKHEYLDYTNCVIIYNNPVKVYDGGDKIIGYGNLYLENNILVGNLFLDYGTSERLDLQADILLYPHIAYSSYTYEPFVGGIATVKQIQIEEIYLTKYPPEDSRIGPIN
jgi:hypothetical protein